MSSHMLLRAVLFGALVSVPAVLADEGQSSSSSFLRQLATSQFSGFLKLVERAGLVDELETACQQGRGMTVFAPTDEALLEKTSPTVLSYLQQAENREALRAVLRSHFIPETLSPFQWQGTHLTLAGTSLLLTMDAQAFYAGPAAVLKYNALTHQDGTVHAIPTLILPEGALRAAQSNTNVVAEGMELRRMLAAPAPRPAGFPGVKAPPLVGIDKPPSSDPVSNFAPSSALASLLSTIVAAAVAALL